MYAATLSERLAATTAKLEAIERLLAVEQQGHEITKREAANWKESHRLQQINTGAFFEELKKAEGKLAQIKELIGSDDESREKVRDIRRVLSESE